MSFEGYDVLPHIEGWRELEKHLVSHHAMVEDVVQDKDSDELRKMHRSAHVQGNYVAGKKHVHVLGT